MTIRTIAIKAKIDKTQAESKCRFRGKVVETVRHIVCEILVMAQREYKRRHEWVGRKIHWEAGRKIVFDVNEKWCKHKPEKVVENDYGILQYKMIMSLRQEDLIQY